MFTDVDMGSGKDGLWLALQVRGRWPPVQIIVTSGHRNITADMLPANALFIAKPYLEDQVIREMKKMAALVGREAKTLASCFYPGYRPTSYPRQFAASYRHKLSCSRPAV